MWRSFLLLRFKPTGFKSLRYKTIFSAIKLACLPCISVSGDWERELRFVRLQVSTGTGFFFVIGYGLWFWTEVKLAEHSPQTALVLPNLLGGSGLYQTSKKISWEAEERAAGAATKSIVFSQVAIKDSRDFYEVLSHTDSRKKDSRDFQWILVSHWPI